MSKDAVTGVLRIGAALVIVLALAVQAWADVNYGTFTWAQLPAFFTPIAALVAVVALLAAAIYRLRGLHEPSWVSLLRVNAATYGVITGLVYWSFLAGVATPVFPWANFVLHGGAGAFLVADWLCVRTHAQLPLSTVWTVLPMPIAWIAYLVIRAYFDGWVPYPFLDPSRGTGVVLGTIGFIAFIGVLVAGILHIGARWRVPLYPGPRQPAGLSKHPGV